MAVTNDMSADRRVARHVAVLREAGHDVVIVHRAPQNGSPLSTLRSPLSALHSPLSTPHSSGWRFYLEFNIELRRRLLELKPDVVWANDTDTLLGCWLAARRLRSKLVMDAHELFPEVPEIQHKPLVKWVWRTIERMLMPRCNALLTVCQSIADYYKEKYGVEMAVVRNISSLNSHSPNPSPRGEGSGYPECEHSTPLSPGRGAGGEAVGGEAVGACLLYQGCVNLGRGVDWAIDALEYLPQCRLVVAGRGDLLEQMKDYAASKPWADRVEFLGHVPPDELPALTCKADVGLVMLEDMGLSYYYALPNRIGDFVAAGVPMVVSDLPEMAAVVRRFGVGEVIEIESSKLKIEKECSRALAKAVELVLSRTWSDADFAEARKDMDWNKEKQKLIDICYTTFC